jgi:hypothetical protein
MIATMRVKRTSPWRRRTALLILFSVSTGSAALAQTAREASGELGAVLRPGMTVWITDSAGREEKTRIVGVSGDIVTATAGDVARRLRTTDIMRVRARHTDSVLNGALIGAGAAVASGVFLCTLTEPWENCRDDIGPMVRIGAIGAGVGIGIDALIRRRRTIYEAAPGSARLRASPILARHAAGVLVSVDF